MYYKLNFYQIRVPFAEYRLPKNNIKMKNIITTAFMLTIGMSAMAQKNISQNIEEKDGKLKIHV